MQFSIRVLLALFAIGAFAGIGVWGIVAVLHATWLTESQRMIAVGGIVGTVGRMGNLRLARVLG